MNFNNDNEVLDFFYRLLDMLHQADLQNFGSHIQLVYVAPGAQHVDHVDNQYFYGDKYLKPSKSSSQEASTTAHFSDDTNVDALAITHFEFDKKQIYSNRVYYDLLDLDALGALQVSLSQLACYLADHSNLSSSQATLYRQLKMYRQERT